MKQESERPRQDAHEQEQSEQPPKTAEILSLIQELKEEGFDYEDEDISHISQMDSDDAFAYLMFGLAERGIDPEEYLTQKGYASAFELLSEEPEDT